MHHLSFLSGYLFYWNCVTVVTVFPIYTSIVHYVEDEEQHTKAYAIVSDTMAHSSLSSGTVP